MVFVYVGGMGMDGGLDAPAHPSKTILWPHIICFCNVLLIWNIVSSLHVCNSIQSIIAFRDENKRRKTFEGFWCDTWPVSAKSLAQAGFYYCGKHKFCQKLMNLNCFYLIKDYAEENTSFFVENSSMTWNFLCFDLRNGSSKFQRCKCSLPFAILYRTFKRAKISKSIVLKQGPKPDSKWNPWSGKIFCCLQVKFFNGFLPT